MDVREDEPEGRPWKKRKCEEWVHFTVTDHHSDGSPVKVKCKHCIWAGSANVTRMRHHLERKHLGHTAADLASSAEDRPKMQCYLEKGLSLVQKDRAVDLLLKFKVQSAVPYNALESEAFQAFVHALRPGFLVPTRRTLQRRVTEEYLLMIGVPIP